MLACCHCDSVMRLPYGCDICGSHQTRRLQHCMLFAVYDVQPQGLEKLKSSRCQPRQHVPRLHSVAGRVAIAAVPHSSCAYDSFPQAVPPCRKERHTHLADKLRFAATSHIPDCLKVFCERLLGREPCVVRLPGTAHRSCRTQLFEASAGA
jgi:hypothetical protein